MRKLMVVATVATIATVGMVSTAGAQVSYPTTNVPSRVQGRYGYPSTNPSYPQQYPQYPTTSQRHHAKKHHAKKDRDGDEDDNGRWADRSQHDNGRHNGFDHSRHNGYGSNANGMPSRVDERNSNARARGRYGQDREDRSNRDWRHRG